MKTMLGGYLHLCGTGKHTTKATPKRSYKIDIFRLGTSLPSPPSPPTTTITITVITILVSSSSYQLPFIIYDILFLEYS